MQTRRCKTASITKDDISTLYSTVTFWRCAAQVISSVVIFAVTPNDAFT